MIILGVDPGVARLGVAVVNTKPLHDDSMFNSQKLVYHHTYETDKKLGAPVEAASTWFIFPRDNRGI